MDFDEAAGSAVEKRKFLAKQSRAGEVTPRRVGWWRRSQRRSRSVRECDGSVFTHYIVRRQSRWIAAIHHWRITRRAFVEVSTINDIIQRTGNESWPDKNNGVQRILRLWKPVTEDGMKTTRNNSPAAVKTTGMAKWLLQRLLCKEQGTDQPKTSWAKTKKNRMEYHMFWGLGPRISETGNKSSS